MSDVETNDINQDIYNIEGMQMCDVKVGKPVKEDNSLIGKIRTVQNKRLYVGINNAVVVSRLSLEDLAFTRTMTLIDLHVSSSVRKQMTLFDEYLVAQVQGNKQKWFSRGLDSSVIDEYYKRSVLSSSANGSVLRLRVINDAASILMEEYHKHNVDIVLQCKGLRFFKHCFAPEWVLVSVKKVQPTFLNSVLDDEDDDAMCPPTMDEEAALGCTAPDPEQFSMILSDLKAKASFLVDTIAPEFDSLKQKMHRLREIQDMIDNSKPSLQAVDALADELDLLSGL
jgi:hypothetical protein